MEFSSHTAIYSKCCIHYCVFPIHIPPYYILFSPPWNHWMSKYVVCWMQNAQNTSMQHASRLQKIGQINGASRLYILKVRIKTFVIWNAVFTVFPRVWLWTCDGLVKRLADAKRKYLAQISTIPFRITLSYATLHSVALIVRLNAVTLACLSFSLSVTQKQQKKTHLI